MISFIPIIQMGADMKLFYVILIVSFFTITSLSAEALIKKNDCAPLYSMELENLKKNIEVASYYSQIQNNEKALQIIKDLLIQYPNNHELLDLAIQYSMLQTDYDSALFYINNAIALNYDLERFLKIQSDIYLMENDFVNAIYSYTNLYKNYPTAEYAISLSNLYRIIHDYKNAEYVILPYLLIETPSSDIVTSYINLLLEQNRFDDALDIVISQQLEDSYLGLIVQGGVKFSKNKYKEAEYYYLRALKIDSSQEETWLKLADIYIAQNKFRGAEKIYCYYLNKDNNDILARMGLGNLALKKEDFKKSREIFKSVLCIEPSYSDAQMGMVNTYIYNEENLKAISELNKIPLNDNVLYTKAEVFNSINMNSDAKRQLSGIIYKDADELRYKIKKDNATTITMNYTLFIQILAETYKLNMNKWGTNVSQPIGNNTRAFMEYNQYVYSSGQLPTGRFNDFVNEPRMGVEGRPTKSLEYRADIGAKIYQTEGIMANTDSWIRKYFNDRFNLRLGFRRNNVEQTYLSAVGTKIDGVFTGQVADNKIYLDYEAKFPKRYYSLGRFSYGDMMGQNLPNNQYLEGMLGFGKIFIDRPKAECGFNLVSAEVISYNSAYEHNLLNLYNSAGQVFGGYFSPAFFTANTLNAKAEGKFKCLKNFRYGLKTFVGSQNAIKPTGANPAWGVGAYVTYDVNDHISFNLGYTYYNYVEVQRNLATLNIIIRVFNSKKRRKLK